MLLVRLFLTSCIIRLLMMIFQFGLWKLMIYICSVFLCLNVIFCGIYTSDMDARIIWTVSAQYFSGYMVFLLEHYGLLDLMWNFFYIVAWYLFHCFYVIISSVFWLSLCVCSYSDPFHEVKRKRDKRKEVHLLLNCFHMFFLIES